MVRPGPGIFWQDSRMSLHSGLRIVIPDSSLWNVWGENYQNISFSAQNESANVQRTGHTLEEWDLMELGLGQAVVSLAGTAPFLFRFPRYCVPCNSR